MWAFDLGRCPAHGPPTLGLPGSVKRWLLGAYRSDWLCRLELMMEEVLLLEAVRKGGEKSGGFQRANELLLVGRRPKSALPRNQSARHIAIAAQNMQSIRKYRDPITY